MSKCPPGHVPVDKIIKSEVALRAVDESSEPFLELCESIRRHGILNSVTVRETKDKEGNPCYGLVDGLQRFTAAKAVGLEFIPANITGLNEADVLEAQIVANVHKIETKPAEYTKQLARIIMSNPMLTLRELAKRLSKSLPWLEQRLSLSKLDENIQKLVDEGKIKLQNAFALAKLPVEEQANFVDRAMTDSPKEFVPAAISRAQELASAKREGRKAKSAEFEPVMHLRKTSELKEALTDKALATKICEKEGVKKPMEGFTAALKWAFNIDADGLATQKAKFDARKKEREEAKARRDAERAEKKAKEAAEKATDIEKMLLG